MSSIFWCFPILPSLEQSCWPHTWALVLGGVLLPLAQLLPSPTATHSFPYHDDNSHEVGSQDAWVLVLSCPTLLSDLRDHRQVASLSGVSFLTCKFGY